MNNILVNILLHWEPTAAYVTPRDLFSHWWHVDRGEGGANRGGERCSLLPCYSDLIGCETLRYWNRMFWLQYDGQHINIVIFICRQSIIVIIVLSVIIVYITIVLYCRWCGACQGVVDWRGPGSSMHVRSGRTRCGGRLASGVTSPR